jgi:succinate dehydrogenase flavin-adding protein (antitoxin of CptAB toxin-antitoxin module)
MNDKINLVRFLEDTTIGATASMGLENMTERELDSLIRLCKVDPDDEDIMEGAMQAMRRRDAYRAERMKKIRQIQAEELNVKYDRLTPEMKRQFIEFILDNLEAFGDIDMDWLIDPLRYPPVEFWTGVHGIVMNEIVNRLLFGLQEKENREPIDSALAAHFTYSDTKLGSICSDLLIDALDSDIKQVIFWKYASARLREP